MTPDRPTGEVTFLFTDIEGSTKLVDALGTAAWTPLLARHRRLIRDALGAHGGAEVLTEGDSFFVVFRNAVEATLAATDAQRTLAAEPWPEGTSIRVRMGLHTGLGVLDGDGSYVGHDVHRAARVASAAHGGQVLLSESAAERVAGHLPDGLGLRPLGSHRLKDLRPERIAQLVVAGLRADFPPIRSLDARPNNLPTELTSFVGRERELDDARRLLGEARLVTFTGPGGTGKSRLALQVAAAAADGFPDGTWFVPLAAVADAALVPSAIVRAIGLGEVPGTRPLDALVEELQSRVSLLVLDNLEQVAAAAADLGELLRRAPKVRILATSRSPLRVSGEYEYPVPGLPAPVDVDRLGAYERERLPEALRRRDPASLLAFEAVRLFVARGAAVRPGFALAEGNAADVAAIVAHLGGVPLAIELAAARLRFLTPAAIHDRLEGRLDLPGAGAADVPERQRSLRGAIAWSYDLLEPGGRRLFERISVFVNGFDLAGAERVAGTAAELGLDPLDGLASLVDQSLVRSEDAEGEPRFTMLEPIREYALERLAEAGDADAIREHHARWFLDLATGLEPGLAGAEQRQALDRLEREHPNFRAAIEWADGRGDAAIALGIATAIWRFWQRRGYLGEARTRMASLLARPWFADAPAPLRARAHEVMGGIVYWHGEFAEARPDYEAALAIWRELGDRKELANALYNLSFCYSMGELHDAEGADRANALLVESLALYRSMGDDRGIADVLWGIGIQHYFRSENEEAVVAFDASLEAYRRVGDQTQEAWALHQAGSSRLKLGQLDEGREQMKSALRIFDAAGDVAGVTISFDDLSAVAVADGELERAARLDGLARRLQLSSGTGLAGAVLNDFEVATRPFAVTAIEPAMLARHQAEGAGLTLAAGVAYALGEATWAEAAASSAAAAAGASDTSARADGTADGAAPGHDLHEHGDEAGMAGAAGTTS